MNWNRTTAYCIGIAVIVWLFASAGVCQSAAHSNTAKPREAAPFAMVNGKRLGIDLLNDKMEQLYPSATVHGRAGGSPELRKKAIDAVILDELIWQEATSKGKVAPRAEAEKEMFRFREQYGAQAFDSELATSGMPREQYIAKLQRAMTIANARKEHVDIPAQAGPDAVRTYYETNKNRFRRPERVRFRLILVGVDPKATPKSVGKAKKKAEAIYAKLKAGADFGDVAYESSEDIYRVKGGDVGWMHKGSIDAEFEKIVFSLPIGRFTEPFRSSRGFSIVKVEEREPARDMSFEEVREKLQSQMVTRNSKRLRDAWETQLRKNARIKVLNSGVIMRTAAQPMRLRPSH